MIVEVKERNPTQASRRRVPRFRVQAALDVTVLRSGVPDTVPGRSLNLCERGLGAILAGEVAPGEAVGIEVRLPSQAEFLKARAVVKYQEKLRCGLEFVGLSAEQRAAIRSWAKESQAETEASLRPLGAIEVKTTGTKTTGIGAAGKLRKGSRLGKPKKPFSAAEWSIFALVAIILLAAVLWRWNRGWQELESGLSRQEIAAAEKPQVQVPAEVMQKLLIHRVEPSYPAEARRQKLEGVIAVDMVVGRDGSVVSMRPLNGPDVLSQAAMDALRWWKFEPYQVNGKPAVVETTLAVEFKP